MFWKKRKSFYHQELPPIALLAGEGKMPFLVLEGIRAAGRRVLLLAIHGSAEDRLISLADYSVSLYVTELGKAIQTCLKHGVKELVMVGRVHHKNIFSVSLFKLDWTAFCFWWKLKDRRADSLLKGIADLFFARGITLMNSVKYLQSHLAKEGVLTDKKPSSSLWQDIHFGSKLAKEIGRLDIGQAVVVKQGSVVAVEAMEGTDQCIERAGLLAGPGCVVVKMAKPNQDMRFDVPVVGINTIEKLIKVKAAALAIEAGTTVILDPEAIEVANKHGIIIVSIV
ncbi:MAG: UDP-2,3-diacylglucosamine diphosphatase LpxI [Chlamydiales bacterium]|nr:UDP-2,3-diacylglucosamine diphosphatase LpxI [Chlamydiales bacterium]